MQRILLIPATLLLMALLPSCFRDPVVNIRKRFLPIVSTSCEDTVPIQREVILSIHAVVAACEQIQIRHISTSADGDTLFFRPEAIREASAKNCSDTLKPYSTKLFRTDFMTAGKRYFVFRDGIPFHIDSVYIK